MTSTSTAPPGAAPLRGTPARPASGPWSGSVEGLRRRHDGGAAVAAGDVVAEVLAGHDYLDTAAPRANVTGVGAVRFVNEHLAEVARLWDGPAKLTGRHVVLALALEPAVGGLLLTSGDVASLLAGWQIEEHDDAGPLLVWDLLSVAGRDLADEQPLLAAALGAPAEWTVRLSGKVTHLVWAPLGERLAFCTASDVYEVTRGSAPRRIGTVEGEVLSVGWGTRGVVALRRRDGAVELTRVADGRLVGGAAQADAGVLSRDGAVAWFSRSDALERRTMSVSAGEPVPGSGRPLAIDAAGRLGLVQQEDMVVLVDAGSTGTPAPVAGVSSRGVETAAQAPYALIDGAGGRAVVAAARDGACFEINSWMYSSKVTARCLAVCWPSTRSRARLPIRRRSDSGNPRRCSKVSSGEWDTKISFPVLKKYPSPPNNH